MGGSWAEADVCIVYPSLAFNLQLCNPMAADSQHHCCSQNAFCAGAETVFSSGFTVIFKQLRVSHQQSTPLNIETSQFVLNTLPTTIKTAPFPPYT